MCALSWLIRLDSTAHYICKLQV